MSSSVPSSSSSSSSNGDSNTVGRGGGGGGAGGGPGPRPLVGRGPWGSAGGRVGSSSSSSSTGMKRGDSPGAAAGFGGLRVLPKLRPPPSRKTAQAPETGRRLGRVP